MVDNEYQDKSEIYKGEKTIIHFTFIMACKDPQFAANFLYKALKKEKKENLFPIFKERVVNLLELERYNYEASYLRTINKIKIEKK